MERQARGSCARSLDKSFVRAPDSLRWTIVRGSAIGFFVGILPGTGATVASAVAYGTEKRVATDDASSATATCAG